MPTILPGPLIGFARRLFEAAGVPAADGGVVAHHLVDANLCGHDSHGVMRVPQYLQLLREGKYKANVPLAILKETPAVVAADAQWGLGQVQALRLLDKLIPKAKALGLAAGSLRQCGHSGRLGAYAELAASHRLALFATVNTHGSGRRVAPPGGTQGRISTNPICFGIPTAAEPVVLDFGTSVAAEGKVRVHFQKGDPVPEGWLLNAAGQPTTNPGDLYADPPGTLLPFGGSQAYKGFGLGLVLDLLAGGLSGGKCSNPQQPMPGVGNAVVFTLFDPEQFGGLEHFLKETTGLAEYVRTCPPAAGVDRITLPGDPERAVRARRLTDGVPIPDGTWALLAKDADTHGVPLPA